MATNYNPRIVTDGLVLALDAGNNKSHSTNRFISYGSGLVTENVTFAINGTGTFQRVAAGTVIGGYTVKTTDVVYSYALGGTGCHYHGNTTPIPAGVYATFTFDYLVTGATTYPVVDYLANFESALNGAIGTANSLQNVWQRRSFTAGPTGSAANLNAYLYPGACGASNRLADSGTIYYRNPRVEFSSVDTGTDNFSSMPNLTTWYNLNNGTNNGTLTNTPYHFIGNTANGTGGYMSFDGTDDYVSVSQTLSTPFTISGFIRYTDQAKTLNTFINSNPHPVLGISLNRLGSGELYVYIGNGSGWFATPAIASSSNMLINTWYQITFTSTGSGSTLYLNGTSVGTSIYSPSGWGSTYYLGASNAGGFIEFLRGNISSVQIYNKALTAAEVQQNFNAQRSRFGI